METRDRKFAGSVFSPGSALILAVVLTSILAIVGVLFVMMARVDKVATSAIPENRELGLAVETVIARISQQLVSDIPGVAGQEYYDYPDPCNAWLANLEPYQFAANDYRWRQISDVYRFFGPGALDLPAVLVPDYQDPCIGNGLFADADGDGVADSRWVIIPNMSSSKGKPILAAIRVVDNEAMLNVNTSWKFEFDPNVIVDANRIDGSSQLQINLMALSWRPGFTVYNLLDEMDLLLARANYGLGVVDPCDLRAYERDVIWRYGRPNGPYTPFDISDELELRYRYLLNHSDIDTRLEPWGGEFRSPSELNTPVSSGGIELDRWFYRSQHDVLGPNDTYSYRHLATTYNMDRIIDPNGEMMINVNTETSAFKIYERLLRSIYPFVADPNTNRRFIQLAVNMVDFIDNDANVTTFIDPCGTYYGFEAQPFINEIAWKIAPNFFALELHNPFDRAIDLGNYILEFINRNDPADQYSITFPFGQFIEANGYFVIVNQPGQFVIYNDPNTPTTIRVDPALRFFGNWISSEDKSKPPVDRRPDPDKSKPPIPQGVWGNIYDMSLLRSVLVPAPGTMIYVDNQAIEPNLAFPGSTLAYGRDDRDWRIVYQTLAIDAYGGSLGMANYPRISPSTHLYSFFLPNPLYPRAEFITVGDIPRILTLGHGTTRNSTIGRQLMAFERLEINTLVDQEYNVRLDLQDPLYRNVFQYLTVFDPNSDSIDNDADGLIDGADTISPEVQIPGRINVNTAPWYVIAQLPWMTNEIAQAIVAYRDKLALVLGVVDYSTSLWGPPDDFKTRKYGMDLQLIDPDVREEPGFASIGELLNVTHYLSGTVTRQYNPLYDIRSLSREATANDLAGFPDLTTYGPGLGDGIADDFEERDVIFSRISNLVSVRSDVFTAYILVRIGADGPQKRVIAILDRSGVNKSNFRSPDGKVRIVSLHYVPDPR
jgi:hypothetical protein